MTENSQIHSSQNIAIVGGGLGGALCACFFAKHGIQVHLFELRPDIRTQAPVTGRNINLGLSRRGRAALAYINCEDLIIRNCVPMRGRMIHDLNCHTHAIPYGANTDHEVLSIDRRILNGLLLDEASKRPEITIHFQHKFIAWNSDDKIASFHDGSDKQIHFKFDAIIGYDGCHSAVRTAMMKTDIINYTQEYIDSYYVEFHIPSKNNEFPMEGNYLHIWPHNEFLLVAAPNQDKSFTTSLFLPIAMYRFLTTADKLLSFFEKYFPDAISLIGSDNLVDRFFSSKPLPVISIKCSPHVTFRGDILLMGDAAHAMVPFYAQGMNSAFEDCLVLFEKLKENQFDFEKAFIAYDNSRVPDAHAVVDLSMYNYLEMRSLVTQRSYYWRKKIDNFLYRLVPYWWIPLYTMVTFTRIPYKQCLKLRERQDHILKSVRLISYTIIGCFLLKQFVNLCY